MAVSFMNHQDRNQNKIEPYFRVVTNIFILVILAVFLLDTFPFGHNCFRSFNLHSPQIRYLATSTSNQISETQEIWNLFAPDPVTASGRLSAILIYPDGQTERKWQKSQLHHHGRHGNFWKQHNRMINFIHYIRKERLLPRNRILAPLARHLAQHRKHPRPNERNFYSIPRLSKCTDTKNMMGPPYNQTELAQLKMEQPGTIPSRQLDVMATRRACNPTMDERTNVFDKS